jgi:hypothetical protein
MTGLHFEFYDSSWSLNTLVRGPGSLEAVPAGTHEAQLSPVKKGSPLIQRHSVSYLSDGTLVEYYTAAIALVSKVNFHEFKTGSQVRSTEP